MEDRPSRLTQTDILLDPGELEIDKSLCPSELMSSLFKYPSKHRHERGRCYLGWILAAPHGARCSRHDDLRNSRSRFTTRADRMPHLGPTSWWAHLLRHQAWKKISRFSIYDFRKWCQHMRQLSPGKQDGKMGPYLLQFNGRVGAYFRNLRPWHRWVFGWGYVCWSFLRHACGGRRKISIGL